MLTDTKPTLMRIDRNVIHQSACPHLIHQVCPISKGPLLKVSVLQLACARQMFGWFMLHPLAKPQDGGCLLIKHKYLYPGYITENMISPSGNLL